MAKLAFFKFQIVRQKTLINDLYIIRILMFMVEKRKRNGVKHGKQ